MNSIIENLHPVVAFPPAASPASTEDAVSMKGCKKALVVLTGDNATSVTGATVTLKQSTVVALTDEKALEFDWVYANTDTGASDALTKTAVTSDTFDTTTTNNKNWMYAIEVDAASLDTANGFCVLRVDVTGNANCVCAGVYLLDRQRYAGGTPSVSAITD